MPLRGLGNLRSLEVELKVGNDAPSGLKEQLTLRVKVYNVALSERGYIPTCDMTPFLHRGYTPACDVFAPSGLRESALVRGGA